MTRRTTLNKPHRKKPDAVRSSTVLQQAMLVVSLGAMLAVSALLSSSTIGDPGIYLTDPTRVGPSKAYNSFMLFSGGDQTPGGAAVQHHDGLPASISDSEKAVTP